MENWELLTRHVLKFVSRHACLFVCAQKVASEWECSGYVMKVWNMQHVMEINGNIHYECLMDASSTVSVQVRCQLRLAKILSSPSQSTNWVKAALIISSCEYTVTPCLTNGRQSRSSFKLEIMWRVSEIFRIVGIDALHCRPHQLLKC